MRKHIETRLDQLCEAMYIASGHKVKEELKDRRKEQVAYRNMIQKQLRDDGFTLVAIAEVFGKNHSTVIHAISSCNDLLQYPIIGDEDFIEVWEEFQKRIEE